MLKGSYTNRFKYVKGQTRDRSTDIALAFNNFRLSRDGHAYHSVLHLVQPAFKMRHRILSSSSARSAK